VRLATVAEGMVSPGAFERDIYVEVNVCGARQNV